MRLIPQGRRVAGRGLAQLQGRQRTLAQTHSSQTHSSAGAAGPGVRLDDAMQQLQSAAAPLLQLLNPKVRDSIQRIARGAEK